MFDHEFGRHTSNENEFPNKEDIIKMSKYSY